MDKYFRSMLILYSQRKNRTFTALIVRQAQKSIKKPRKAETWE